MTFVGHSSVGSALAQATIHAGASQASFCYTTGKRTGYFSMMHPGARFARRTRPD